MKATTIVLLSFATLLFAQAAFSACTLGSLGPPACNSTGGTAGITAQIVAQLNAMGRSFRRLNPSLVHCPGWACVLQSSAADSLEATARSKNDYITLSSAYRSSAEQYVLYKWYLNHQCGIPLAAKPGQSNHEAGRAIDTPNYNYWMTPLLQHGWTHPYSNDVVHFDYPPAQDFSKDNLRAFQILYNRHNTRKIAEDGEYGPDTANAFYNAPCNGW
eukprot:TRINITY_DN263_c0_g1_i1.p1 TRINITY_DN263_c0_g1~~TRINITY_DN263_c0_g1_i1.p1  ORF type:complete len:231 (-),score=46.35 TRINITY_DN263_c0_g1_i1:83-730(-)